ncbi:hypothetical protein WJX81_006747 [Elliptochloris bilobata]|uniref:Multiple myeloma tumor-associated protein 2-like N-terminal domain-containing protein n=1 Tax=Elliptochloris bilobata TaxID=381761 RepID=A0AAW1S7K9_9CHLO
MSLYNGPPRGGTRGGADQFSWESVKADPDREFYLGHSVKATTGRWQKGKDVFWYTREKKGDDDAAAAEMLAIKQREEDLMAEALGIKPRTLRPMARAKLDKKDVAQLLSRGEEGEEPNPAAEADRIQGLGFAAGAHGSMEEPEREVLAGVGLDRPMPPPPGRPGAPQAGPGPPPGGGPPAGSCGGGSTLPGPPAIPAAALKLVKEAQKKAAKEARKEERAAAKTARKAKRRAKRERLEREAPSPPSSPFSGPANQRQGH